jgi:hypothetical protein
MARKIIRPLATGKSQLRPLPAIQRRQRVAVYVRVSSEEQLEGYSLEAQLRAIRGHCAERGWDVSAEYVEEGKSARYEDLSRRPRFKVMLEAAEARQFDVVLVHKLGRFARNPLVLLTSLNRLGRADVSNGLLPFGAMPGLGGVPVADTRTVCVLNWVERDGRPVVEGGRETCNLEGLQLAFRLAAEGLTDSQVAQALTAAGFRTTGNRGQNPFRRDTVAEMLTNRFYWGELPVFEEFKGEDGVVRKVQVGWTDGRHEALPGFEEELWERIVAAREANRRGHAATRHTARTYSLTGLAACHACGGRIGIWASWDGRPRLRCRTRIGHPDACGNVPATLDVYEAQIGAFLASFHVPDDVQQRFLAAATQIAGEADAEATERRQLEARLDRIKRLYEWGDKAGGRVPRRARPDRASAGGAQAAARDRRRAGRLAGGGAPQRPQGLVGRRAGGAQPARPHALRRRPRPRRPGGRRAAAGAVRALLPAQLGGLGSRRPL